MRKYGYTRSGEKIVPNPGWRILGEGERVPQVHCEFINDYDGYSAWAQPRRCHSTMTPIYAGVCGYVMAIAVPEEA